MVTGLIFSKELHTLPLHMNCGMISLHILFYFVALVCRYSCGLYVHRSYIKTDARRSIIQILWWDTSNSTIILCLEVTRPSRSWSNKVQLFACLRNRLFPQFVIHNWIVIIIFQFVLHVSVLFPAIIRYYM